MEHSPLDCPKFNKELQSPVLLKCLHTICLACNTSPCNICPVSDTSDIPSVKDDRLAAFLIETSHEESESCANCEKVVQPMFFCETCQQSLCHDCRLSTHQAKMFSKHRVLRAEERARVRGRIVCENHHEPYILFSVNQRKLVCIQCFNDTPVEERHHLVSIESGHKRCVSKIDKWSAKLKLYQEEKREELEVRHRVLSECENSHDAARKGLFQLCQQIVDTVLSTRDRLSLRLSEDKKESEGTCKSQIDEIEAVVDPVRLCLTTAQILCASAAKLDVLQLAGELNERIQTIISRSVDKLPALRPIHSLESRTEIAKALEPYLGLSAAWCPISAVREGSREGSGSTHSHSYKVRSGSHMVSMPPMLSKFQTIIDLSGTFGQLFGRVEGPLKEIVAELSSISQQVQETQRDLTMRRCLIKSDTINALIKQCQTLEARLGLHASQVEEMQPDLQQIWQEQLDRVRRQQIIFREKVDECSSLRGTARDVVTAARQLAPFAACIENMSALIDPRRCHPPDPAPMESICLQISTIEPDSEGRIAAIEKEELNRKAVQEAKKREEIAERGTAVKGLKPGKAKRKDVTRLMVNTTRERSPGGTDTALISPCVRRISTAVREETASDVEAEEVWADESFDMWPDEMLCTVDVALDEQTRCSSSLSLFVPLGSEHTSPSTQPSTPITSNAPSPVDSLRMPLATRVTPDIGTSRQSMLQSLHNVFASQRDRETESDGGEQTVAERNVSASAVKIIQKKQREGPDDEGDALYNAGSTVLLMTTSSVALEKKEPKRRRRKRDSSIDEVVSPVEIMTPLTTDSALQMLPSNEPSPVPQVPYVPTSVFELGDTASMKLGCFEAKEKLLQSLREKVYTRAGSDPTGD